MKQLLLDIFIPISNAKNKSECLACMLGSPTIGICIPLLSIQITSIMVDTISESWNHAFFEWFWELAHEHEGCGINYVLIIIFCYMDACISVGYLFAPFIYCFSDNFLHEATFVVVSAID